MDWTLVKAGQVETKTSSIRIYTYREICSLLTEVGFTGLDAFSSLTGEAFKLGQRLYIVAVKADALAPERPPAVGEADEEPPAG